MSDETTLPPFAANLVPVDIADEMRTSYMDYSMSVIIGRALPDVRDGLKPVHRRILYAMLREGLVSTRKYSKCAGVVGEVLKKYHPHGDSAVYDALVRMAQPWNMRMELVDGQGNFGSVDGDPAAAYRYTECRLTRVAEELLRDIDKETVDHTANFDGTELEPVVLPSRFPNLLVNGSDGIAVGMATKIPPHNLGEVIDACVALIDDPHITVPTLVARHVPGPDFPTGAFIHGRAGVVDAYTTGRGRVVVRARTHFEENGDRPVIVVDELPFQVNKARLLEQIAEHVKERRIEGIAALRDESDRQGMRMVIELKRDAFPDIVLNKLFKHTDLQTTFGVILLAIVQGRPMVLTLKEMLEHYVAHQREVVARRTRFDLRKAQQRAHILEGLRIALDHIDAVIALIRASQTADEARSGLMERFGLSEVQAQAILDMRLQRLVGLERDKIELEYAELLQLIERLTSILASEALLMQVVKDELLEIRDRYADPRRTEILEASGDLDIKDLIAEEDQVITLSMRGYVKRTPMVEYQEQHRGGLGRRGMVTRDEDSIRDLFIANTHAQLLVFTNRGRMVALPVYAVPEGGLTSKGKPLVRLVTLEPDEEVAAVVPVNDFEEDVDLLFCSRKGLVKRTRLSEFRNVRSSGLRAYDCADGDTLLMVYRAGRQQDLLIATRLGKAIRFPADEVRPMGRVARGVKGITLREDDEIVDMQVCVDDPEMLLLTVTEKGYGTRTELAGYRVTSRGGLGIINVRTADKNGLVVGTVQVHEHDRVMLMTNTGRVIKIPVRHIRVTGRNAIGVRLMRVEDGEFVAGIARVVEEEDDAGTDVPESGEE